MAPQRAAVKAHGLVSGCGSGQHSLGRQRKLPVRHPQCFPFKASSTAVLSELSLGTGSGANGIAPTCRRAELVGQLPVPQHRTPGTCLGQRPSQPSACTCALEELCSGSTSGIAQKRKPSSSSLTSTAIGNGCPCAVGVHLLLHGTCAGALGCLRAAHAGSLQLCCREAARCAHRPPC